MDALIVTWTPQASNGLQTHGIMFDQGGPAQGWTSTRQVWESTSTQQVYKPFESQSIILSLYNISSVNIYFSKKKNTYKNCNSNGKT